MTFYVWLPRKGNFVKDFDNPLPSFAAAVRYGQAIAGRGRFHVECPDGYVPSRSEQLLQPGRGRAAKVQQLLDSL
jgi:hypothetical protein